MGQTKNNPTHIRTHSHTLGYKYIREKNGSTNHPDRFDFGPSGFHRALNGHNLRFRPSNSTLPSHRTLTLKHLWKQGLHICECCFRMRSNQSELRAIECVVKTVQRFNCYWPTL